MATSSVINAQINCFSGCNSVCFFECIKGFTCDTWPTIDYFQPLFNGARMWKTCVKHFPDIPISMRRIKNNMARKLLVDKELDDMTECSICTEVFTDPRVLPCIHTFCLKCLLNYGKDRQPGDHMPCPLCRKEFTIPDG